MKYHKHYIRVWNFLQFALLPYIKRKFNLSAQVCDIPGPCLILSNHNTNWDPFLLAAGFPRQMYFVASEHIFRWGFLAAVIHFLVNPIARMKGTTAGDTALTVLRRLKKGANVAIFAEGNRSFAGRTEDILPSTGKLARASGATLVTYRLDGGYFTSPAGAAPPSAAAK